jgi:hypothetical protein
MEQAYTALYFAIFGPFGLFVMYRSPLWYFRTAPMYETFPNRQHEGWFKAYYLLQASYWTQQMIVLLLMLEKPRKDFKELVAHHIITLALIWLSYRFHFTHMGIAVYITHDISDFFLAVSAPTYHSISPLVHETDSQPPDLQNPQLHRLVHRNPLLLRVPLRLDLPPALHKHSHPPLTPSPPLAIPRLHNRTTPAPPLQRNRSARKAAYPTSHTGVQFRTQRHQRAHNRCRRLGDSSAGSQRDPILTIRHHRPLRAELGNTAVQMLDIAVDYIWVACRAAIGEYLLACVDFAHFVAGCQDIRAGEGG